MLHPSLSLSPLSPSLSPLSPSPLSSLSLSFSSLSLLLSLFLSSILSLPLSSAQGTSQWRVSNRANNTSPRIQNPPRKQPSLSSLLSGSDAAGERNADELRAGHERDFRPRTQTYANVPANSAAIVREARRRKRRWGEYCLLL